MSIASLIPHLTSSFPKSRSRLFFYGSSSFFVRKWFRLYRCGIFENGVLLMYTLEGVSRGPRQFTDSYFGDSSPTKLETVHRQRNTVLWVLMKKINGGFEIK